MGVRDAEDLQDALDRPVLAAEPMQRVEGDVGLEAGERVGDAAIDVDAGDAIALRLERIGALRARN